MAMPGLPFEYDLENVLDDWVMMCFFVGNDFLPHLPSLEIREGAIDKLIRLYKDIVHNTGVSDFNIISSRLNVYEILHDHISFAGLFNQERNSGFESRREDNERDW